MIPKLTSAFCGCTLERGTRGIAWFQLVLEGLYIYTILLGAVFVSPMLLIGLGIYILLASLVVFIIQLIATILLMLGAKKKKLGYMMCWLIISLIELFVAIATLSLAGAVYFVVNLYFIWVVYSYYRQIKDSPDPSKHPSPGEDTQDVTSSAPPPHV